MIISAWILLEWEMFQTNVVDKIKTIFYVRKLFSKNCAVYEIMWKNMVDLERPQVAIYYGAEKMQGYVATLTIFNTCFSTVKMVRRKRLKGTLYKYCMSCWEWLQINIVYYMLGQLHHRWCDVGKIVWRNICLFHRILTTSFYMVIVVLLV